MATVGIKGLITRNKLLKQNNKCNTSSTSAARHHGILKQKSDLNYFHDTCQPSVTELSMIKHITDHRREDNVTITITETYMLRNCIQATLVLKATKQISELY